MQMPTQDPAERKRWQALRDKAGVKKGAVKKVSLGDALDKWHKVRTKSSSLIELQKASAKLQLEAKIYADAMQADPSYRKKNTSDAVSKWVVENVVTQAKQWDVWATAAVKDLRGAVLDVISAYKIFKNSRSTGHAQLAESLDKLVAVLETHKVGSYNNGYQEGLKKLKAHAKALAAFDPATPPKIDPISGAQSLVLQLMKSNGFK